MIEDREWQAIENNDASYDECFRYAVKTTKIFCRPSCKSRLPKKENVEIFHDLNEPLKHGYRPCKRCQPTGKTISNDEWVEEIETILKNNYSQKLSLDEIANLAHGSESYVRHVYKKVMNKTLQQRLLEIRLEEAREKIVTTDERIDNIAMEVGIFNVSYFIKRFKEAYGESPKQYRKTNQNN